MSGALARYQEVCVGRRGLWALLKYEFATTVATPFPGAAGYLLRRFLYRRLMKRVGRGVAFGRNVILRHPHKMEIGEGSGFDDDCFLDARGAEEGGFRIGSNVIVARGVGLQVKKGFLELGDDCVIGYGAYLGSAGGIRCGKGVMISGMCYIGGGRYHTDNPDVPMRSQSSHSIGPVQIGDDCWIGAGARILDGVTVGRGCVISAGMVVQQDLPDDTIASPFSKVVQLPRRRP